MYTAVTDDGSKNVHVPLYTLYIIVVVVGGCDGL